MRKLLMIIPLVVLLCFTFGCQKGEEGITEEEAQAFTDRILEMWNEVNLTIVDEVYAPEIVRHDCGVPEDIVGLENMKDYLKNLFNAFPDLHITVDEMIVAGNKMAQRWTMTGTNTGSMGDMPPTGKNVRFSGVSIGHFVNGKAVEIWDFYNALDMMQQLGFTLTPPQPPGTLSPVRAVGSIKPPRLIKEVKPVYPEKAKEAEVEGVVILEATTDIYGRVQNVKVLQSIPLLDQAAVDAVRQWVYEPMIIDGKPRGVIFTVTVKFHLK